ncbi:MAG: hypothetical protein IJQ94_03105 [Bacteroidales bacterium]|jgi:hypothetical protein|nr:hypothetical protein [Bacteroidales bacterium]MBR0304613.1 hypothetical protein [Bacteroidales bacterium]
MMAVFRFFLLLAICLIPFVFLDIKERFPIMVGITLAVTLAYWLGYALLQRKKKKLKE